MKADRPASSLIIEFKAIVGQLPKEKDAAKHELATLCQTYRKSTDSGHSVIGAVSISADMILSM